MDAKAFLGELDKALAAVVQRLDSLHIAMKDAQAALASAALQAHCCSLKQAVEAVQQLVEGARRQHDGCKEHAARTSGSASMLLQLPAELLARVMREAGKEARLVCRCVRDSYGCPGGILRQPQCGYEVDAVQVQYWPATSHRGVLRLTVASGLRASTLPFAVDALQQYQERWPGQGTRLELSTAHAPAESTLAQIRAALPDLWELKTGWWPSNAHNLPTFTALTALSVLCTAGEALGGVYKRGQASGLALLAPRLTHLQLDLRSRAAFQLVEALHPFRTQLTHLALRLDESVRRSSHVGNTLAGLSLLSAVLESLELQSPAAWLGSDLPGALRSMSHLSSLVWSCEGVSEIPDALLPRWAEVGQLHSLALCTPGFYWLNHIGGEVLSVQSLRASFEGSMLPHLVSLRLPLVACHLADDAQHLLQGVPELRQLLSTLQHACPQLTSLQVGCLVGQYDMTEAFWGSAVWEADPDSDLVRQLLRLEQPAEHQWLQPVGGMLQLRRLVLCIDAADMRQLAWLAPLPHLTSLCLDFTTCWPRGAQSRLEPAAIAAVQSLQHLARLSDLTIKLPRAGQLLSLQVLCALLAATARLPQLTAMVISTALLPEQVAEAPWCVLAAHQPPSLQRLTLFHTPEDERGLHAAALSCKPQILAWLQERMPPHVHVTSLKVGPAVLYKL